MFPWHPGRITTLAFSPDNCWLGVGCSDGTVRVWNIRTGEYVFNEVMDSEVRFVSFVSGSSQLIAGSYEGALSLWDVQGKLLQNVPPVSYVHCMTWLPNGQLVVVDGVVGGLVASVWDTDTGTLARPLIHLKRGSWSAADVEPVDEGKIIVHCYNYDQDERTIEIYDLSSGTVVNSLEGLEGFGELSRRQGGMLL